MCMIDPNNIVLSQLTGYRGLGMGALVFDWATITDSITDSFSSPVLVPRFAQINGLVGFVFFNWFLIPLLYYTNVSNFQRLPISITQYYYNKYGTILDIPAEEVMRNSTTVKYYEPIFLSCGDAVGLYLVFGSLAALLVHTILYHGKDILQQFHTSLKRRENDIHCTLMAKYPEAPEWWYILVFIVSFIISAIVCHYGQLMPWYYLCVAIPFTIICLLPIGIMHGTTALSFNVYFVAQFFAGAILNQAVPIFTFVLYSYQLQLVSLSLISNLKFGHYMKISPRSLFIVQLFVTVVSSLIQSGVNRVVVTSDICSTQGWSCAVDYSPVILGAVGASKIIGPESVTITNSAQSIIMDSNDSKIDAVCI
ncbi:unnamed protein product [Didymodactylos carnosus]|uniref:Uncharacterized protein n=1 Tax=Didymodactylos carnosus TaxID=1234261 RepID=A0A814LAS3_9BILA|nr:unnamed protein product [Didymodactylos carnosus]CAF3831633.1 unnamed protein product [Didymodactylos carnosus]